MEKKYRKKNIGVEGVEDMIQASANETVLCDRHS